MAVIDGCGVIHIYWVSVVGIELFLFGGHSLPCSGLSDALQLLGPYFGKNILPLLQEVLSALPCHRVECPEKDTGVIEVFHFIPQKVARIEIVL